jgi:putative DNA methylase
MVRQIMAMGSNRYDLSLLEGDLPLSDLNERSYKERYARKGHPRAIKTWWARRPHIAMRGILYGALMEDSNIEEHRNQLKKLNQDVHPGKRVVQEVREEISQESEDQPKLLDFFSGGGVIPYESERLGLSTHSIELNDVGVLLQKAIIEGPSKYPDIAAEVKKWGEWILKESKKETADLFAYTGNDDPSSSPIVYFFSRTIPCCNCGKRIPLFNISSFSKKENPIFIDLDIADGDYKYNKSTDEPNFENTGRGGKTECLFCSEDITKEYLQECGKSDKIDEEVFAVSTISKGQTGKEFQIVEDSNKKYPEVSESEVSSRIDKILNEIELTVPEVNIKEWSGILNPALYGHDTIDEIFNSRQLLTTLTLVKYIRRSYNKMVEEGVSEEKAEYVLYILTSLTDHLADWNNRFTMWIPQNEQCGRSLAGPGVPMRWDYIEINPFGEGPANLFDKLDRVVTSLDKTPDFDPSVEIKQGDATSLPYSDREFDLIMVDPPYYNSLVYSGLSDFFIPWQEMILKNKAKRFNEIRTHSENEIVAHDAVVENPDQFYTHGLTKSFQEANRVLKSGGMLIVVFSHKTIDGWSSLASSIKQSGFEITNVVPLDMERTARPRAMDSDALSSVMTLVMRKQDTASRKQFSDVQDDIQSELEDQINQTFDQNWVSSDLLTFVFSKSLEYYTKYDIITKEEDLIEFEQYYQRIIDLLGGIIETQFKSIIEASDWDKDTEVYIYYRLQFGLTSTSTEEFKDLLSELGIDGISKLDKNLYTRDGEQIEIPSVILNDTKLSQDQPLLIVEIEDIISHILDQNNVKSYLPDKMSYSADDLRHAINLLAGVELATIGGNTNNEESKKVRRAISKLAEEGNLLQKAENQQTLADF